MLDTLVMAVSHAFCGPRLKDCIDSPIDVHTGNIVLKSPELERMSERDLQTYLGTLETAEVVRSDGKPLEANVPTCLVWPALRKHGFSRTTGPEIRLVDFGGAFEMGNEPKAVRTPLPVRALEALFGDSVDYRVDLWSAGCAVRDTGLPTQLQYVRH